MRKVLFVPRSHAYKHRFYLSKERIPAFQQVLRGAKNRGYFDGLSIDDIKYGDSSHVLCVSPERMNERILVYVFDMCDGYELNTPLAETESKTEK